MEKQTFDIPEGCKSVTVEQESNRLVVTFGAVGFKNGDILSTSGSEYLAIFRSTRDDDTLFYYAMVNFDGDLFFNSYCDKFGFKLATPEQRQLLISKLEENGYRFNEEKCELEKIRWEPKRFDPYFYMNGMFEAIKGSYIPDNGTENGNCFQTEAECQKYCDYMKEMSLNYVK